ncbi:putative serine/threonine-protein kinase/receptor [Histomonas meleagridis]|nr:putative serine/threonine-protein kinase/receptor [Histomonas meleagridis]
MNQFAEAEVSHLINDLSMFKTTNANISSGAFRVDKGIINYTEQFVAMKRAQTEDAYNSLINEFKVLCKISNVTVQSLVGFYPNDDHKKAVLITPFYKNGNLRNVINTQPSEWTLDTKIIVFLGVSYGLKYLHENDIIHHDLTVDNIFIDDNFHPIIGGFGLTHKSIEPDSVSKARYLAPEIINGEKYTKKTDVYTFGLLMNEVFSSKQPYEGLNIQRIKENINNGVLPEISGTTPPVFVSLIKKCLSKDPKKRCKSKKLFNKIRSIYDEISGINRSILDNYKNQIIYSELFPFNNFVIPTPLTDIKSNPHPWDKTSKYPILIKNFESTLRKAGNRPIVLVMLFGPYQSGKSTYLKTLTGNGAFYAGKGTKKVKLKAY